MRRFGPVTKRYRGEVGAQVSPLRPGGQTEDPNPGSHPVEAEVRFPGAKSSFNNLLASPG
jgi:hypothetical protein